MRERKFLYQKKIVDKLKSQIKFLEQENERLSRDNKILNEINDSNLKNIDNMQKEHAKTQAKYEKSLKEVSTLRTNLEELIKHSIKLQQDYENKIEDLLRELRKQFNKT